MHWKAASSGAIAGARLERLTRRRTAPDEVGGDPAGRAVLVRDTRPGDEAIDPGARNAGVRRGRARGPLVARLDVAGPATGIAPALPGALALHLRAAAQQ